MAIATGVVSGLAYLTKASALAALPIWIVIFLAQSFFIARVNAQFSMRDFARQLAIGGVLVGSFLLSVFPYIWTNKQRYGEFFYNVNSAHYMWCDSWPEALSYSEELRNPETRKASLAELPSAQKYWRTHSLEQAAGRLLRGLGSLTKRSAKVVGYYKFVAFLGLTARGFGRSKSETIFRTADTPPRSSGFLFNVFRRLHSSLRLVWSLS